MNVDQYALAKMTLSAIVLGAFFELVFEALRFAGGIFWPNLLHEEVDKKDNAAALVWITVRDFVFLLFCGIAFCIFVYYTNDGKVRLIAVTGTLLGFFGCYFTVGRFIRRTSVFMLNLLYRVLSILFYPCRQLGKCFIRAVVKLNSNIAVSFRRSYTLKEINKLSIVKHNGIP